MELIEVSQRIIETVLTIGSKRKFLEDNLARRRLALIAYYKKKFTVVTNLHNNEPIKAGERNLARPYPISNISALTEVLVAEEKQVIDILDTELKICLASLRALEAELSGLQSIKKHLDEV